MFSISSLNMDHGVSINDIEGVQLLGSSEPIRYKQLAGGLQIQLPEDKPCNYAYCFKIELK